MGDAQFPRTYVTKTQIMFSNMVATAVVAKRENMLGGGEHFVSGAPTVSATHPQKNKLFTVQYSNSLMKVVRPYLRI